MVILGNREFPEPQVINTPFLKLEKISEIIFCLLSCDFDA